MLSGQAHQVYPCKIENFSIITIVIDVFIVVTFEPSLNIELPMGLINGFSLHICEMGGLAIIHKGFSQIWLEVEKKK